MHQIKPWYERYPDRFADESAILDREGYALNKQVLETERRVEFSGKAKYDGRVVFVEFPEGFPSFPPQIRDTPGSQALRRHHNPVTRHFCLFGPGSQRWSAGSSVLNALSEMEELLRLYTTAIASDEEQRSDDLPEPLTSALQYLEGSAVLVPENIVQAISGAAEFSPRNTIKLAYHFHDPAHCNKDIRGRGIVTEAKWQGRLIRGTPEQIIATNRMVDGYLHVLAACPDISALPGIVDHCYRRIIAKSKPKDSWLALVFPQQSGVRHAELLTWVVAKILHDGRYAFVRTFPQRASDRTSRTPDRDLLSLKKVSLVGCGCLGSKIGAALASTGVERFALFDPETFEPNNSVRHECGIEAFGLPKVFALGRRLISLNLRCDGQIVGHGVRVGVTGPRDHAAVMEHILSSDLVIDTTGSHSTSRFLNETCYSNNVPVLFASVTNGAWGGEIVRARPNQDPCWLCWMMQFYEKKPASAPASGPGVFHPGCDQPSFTGTSYETGAVANAAALAAVETLLFDKPGRKGIPAPYLVWHARDEQGRPVLRWEFLQVDRRPGCSICGSTVSINALS